MRFHDEGARLNPRTDFVPDQGTVDKTQGVMGLRVEDEMRIKMGWIGAPHAQDAAALGLPRVRPPEWRGTMQRPGGQSNAGGEAGFQQIATAQTRGIASIGRPCR